MLLYITLRLAMMYELWHWLNAKYQTDAIADLDLYTTMS